MAIAKKNPVSGYTVTLELDQDEADVLLILFNRVGGPPNSKRGVIDRIKAALNAAGVTHPINSAAADPIYPGNSLYFVE